MSAAPDKPESRRLRQVDGLRAIAALGVVAYHYTSRYQEAFPGAAALPGAFRWGHLGVNLFFAISGFVIFMTLERSRSALEFLGSRIARLYPAYWGAIAVTTVGLALLPLPLPTPDALQLLANLSMLQRFFEIPDVDGVYWSLQIELIFYAWMLALWRLGALRRPLLVCGVWIAAALLAKLAMLGTAAAPFGNVATDAPTLLPAAQMNATLLYWFPWFAIGILSWTGLRHHRVDPAHTTVLGLAIFTAAYGERLSVLACALAAALLLHGAARHRLGALQWRPLVFFGAISYPLYLLHQRLGWAVIHHVGDDSTATRTLGIAIAFTMSVLLAWLLHRAIEEPGRTHLRAWVRALLEPATRHDSRSRA